MLFLYLPIIIKHAMEKLLIFVALASFDCCNPKFFKLYLFFVKYSYQIIVINKIKFTYLKV